jgi:hypothetical protein
MIPENYTGLLQGLPDDEYHADDLYLTSSRLKAALPEHYKTGGSPDALAFGTLLHIAVLEPDRLADYAILDAAKIAGDNPKTGRPYDAPQMTARYKAAVAEAQQDGRTVIDQADLDRALTMRDAIAAHDTAARLLLSDDGASEVSAFAMDEAGVRHKARFDRQIPGAVIDLKSTSAKPGADSLARAVVDFGYETSAAHYLAVAELLDLDVQAFVWVFVSKADRPLVTVVEPDEALLQRGRVLRRRAIRRLTDPAADPYEGARGYLTLTCPRWAELTEEIAS